MSKQHIVFDIGGVLVNWQPHLAWAEDLGETGARDFIERTNFLALNARADGAERFDDLAKEVPDPADRPLFAQYVARYDRTIEHLIDGTWALLDRLAARGHGIHAITNWSAETWPVGVQTHPRLGSVFETLVVSGQERILKPDAAIFELLCSRAGISATQCLFIDDSPKNVAGALAAGMDAVRFINPETLEADLIERNLL